MDPQPDAIVRRELQRLLADLDAAKPPSNPGLHQAVMTSLQPMIATEALHTAVREYSAT